MIYAATQWSFEKTNPGKTKRLLDFFSNNLKNSEMLKNTESDYCYYKVSDGTHVFEDSLTHEKILGYEDWLGLNIPSVYIPTTEKTVQKVLRRSFSVTENIKKEKETVCCTIRFR